MISNKVLQTFRQRAVSSLSAHLHLQLRPLTHVCIVGTGPGGFYTAKYLLKEKKDIRVDLLDALPTPYGLVRSGVAPDHAEVKAVQNDFDSVASDPRVRFLGNVAVGKDVSVADLRSVYNAVVLAYGAASDRLLSIPGEKELKHVCSARTFVNWYNGHPEFQWYKPNLDTEDVVIIGQGNVSIDCARILCKTVQELQETDISTQALQALSASRVKRVHIVGRRGHVQASFTTKELRELTKLAHAQLVLQQEELDRGLTEASKQELEKDRRKKRVHQLLMDAIKSGSALAVPPASSSSPSPSASPSTAAATSSDRMELHMRFLLSPQRFLSKAEWQAQLQKEGKPQAAAAAASGTDDPSKTVGAVELAVTELQGPPEDQKAVPVASAAKVLLPAGLVLRSIGFKSVAVDGVPFDQAKAVVRNTAGRVHDEKGEQLQGVYVSGWLKRGPTGIIGSNIPDAKETADCIVEDEKQGRLLPDAASAEGARAVEPAAASEAPAVSPYKPGMGLPALISLITAKGQKKEQELVSWEGYKRIEAAELAKGKTAGKPREKMSDLQQMLGIASSNGQ